MYETACELLAKADWEGGLAELAIGYGISKDEVPETVYEAAGVLKTAYNAFERAVDDWHASPGGCVPDEDIWEGDFCPWK